MPNIRKPRHIRLMDGNPGKRPLPPPIRAELADPDTPAPACLAPEARAIWRTLLPRLVAEKTLASIDLGLLAVFCESLATMQAETAIINEEGTVIETPHGCIVNPRVKVRSDAAARAMKLASVLGIAAGNRTRAAVIESDDDSPEGEIARFFSGAVN